MNYQLLVFSVYDAQYPDKLYLFLVKAKYKALQRPYTVTLNLVLILML